ncbi:hypothetical protein [Nocardioides alcanivorans]|uniref:hypothetical protein n=1 Tax=Nocardioides alcanivorans TaxID=2897352 RepID=UPI001F171E27|nr:hypothetical protein [Nocardioides alcanivorans]
MKRLYAATNAPRCAVCAGPMATFGDRTHPACDPSMTALRRASVRATLRREITR